MFKTGKHLTREEKRRIQRHRANLLGLAAIVVLIAAGFALGFSWA